MSLVVIKSPPAKHDPLVQPVAQNQSNDEQALTDEEFEVLIQQCQQALRKEKALQVSNMQLSDAQKDIHTRILNLCKSQSMHPVNFCFMQVATYKYFQDFNNRKYPFLDLLILMRHVIKFGATRDDDPYQFRHIQIDVQSNLLQIMQLIMKEFASISEKEEIDSCVQYLQSYESEVLSHFDMDVYQYSGYNIFKMLLRLSNDKTNFRQVVSSTFRLAMPAIPLTYGQPHSMIFLASFSKYCESLGQSYLFDDLVSFIESENFGFSKDHIMIAREKIEQKFNDFKEQSISAKLLKKTKAEMIQKADEQNSILAEKTKQVQKLEEKLQKFESMMGGTNPELFSKIECYNSQIQEGQNPFQNGMISFGHQPILAPPSDFGKEQAKAKVDPKEKYKKEIEEMKLMGFEDEAKLIKALDDESGNIDRAIDRMISGGGEEE